MVIRLESRQVDVEGCSGGTIGRYSMGGMRSEADPLKETNESQ